MEIWLDLGMANKTVLLFWY